MLQLFHKFDQSKCNLHCVDKLIWHYYIIGGRGVGVAGGRGLGGGGWREGGVRGVWCGVVWYGVRACVRACVCACVRVCVCVCVCDDFRLKTLLRPDNILELF